MDLSNREELAKAVELGLIAREELTEPEREILFGFNAERRKAGPSSSRTTSETDSDRRR